MQRKKTVIGLQAGLHARPASLFAQEAKKFLSDIYLEKDSKVVNGKSVMGLMSLALKKDMEIHISASGVDADKAILALTNLVNREVLDY